MSYARVRRGEMAADAFQRHFTQISNRLFRDPRLSFKAKGIFGLISTHRDGYGVSPEWIAAAGTDGVSAVKTGLRELEQFGYLVREQERRPDGTRGPMTYSITDMPSSEPVVENRPPVATCGDEENGRSAPVVENPPAVDPPAADRAHKKTSTKKTRSENTTRPSVRTAREVEREPVAEGRTDGSDVHGDGKGARRGPVLLAAPAGAAVLLEVGRRQPRLAVAGKVLADQALKIQARLDGGWSPDDLVTALAVEPPDGMRSAGAVLAARVSRIPLTAAAVPRQPAAEAPRSVARQESPVAAPVVHKCAGPGCERRAEPGHDRCAECLGWPWCIACLPGPFARRAAPETAPFCGPHATRRGVYRSGGAPVGVPGARECAP